MGKLFWLLFFFVGTICSRDPFLKNKKADVQKKYTLRTVVIGNQPFAHIDVDGDVILVEENDPIGSFVVEKIDSGGIILMRNNKRKALELGQSVGE